MKRLWVKIAAAVAGLFLLLLIVVPLLVNADTFRPTLENQLSTTIGRRITLGHLSFSLLSGSLVADDIAIADDPAYSSAPFVQAKSLHIGVELSPLLFHHQVRITKLSVDTPSIQLIHADNGLWNFSSIGKAATSQTPQQETAIPDLTVGELTVKNGSATISSLPSTGKTFTYSDMDLNIEKLSLVKSFPIKLSAKLPGNGTLDLSGEAGPLAAKNAADTPFHATLSIKHFDPVAAGVIAANQGISGIVDLDADTTSANSIVSSRGKIQAANLQLARTGSPSSQPVNVDYAISHNLDTRIGQVSDISIHAGTVAAHVTGSFRETTAAILLNLKLAAPNLPIDQLEQLLPTFGVRLPSGSSLKGGTLTANLAVSGPATATTISGPIEIDNTMLAGFDIGSKIPGLNLLKNASGTQIEKISTTVNSTPQVTQFSSIYGNLPQIGTATGAGTVSASGALNFNMVATLSSNNVVGSVANQAMNTVSNTVGGFVGGFLHPNQKQAPAKSNASRGIPLTITGTASSPTIRANVLSMLK